MIGTQFVLTNQAGDSVTINNHTTDPENVIALQEYPTFEVEIKNQEIQKEGQNGIWDFFSFYGKRLIVFSGVIVGEDEAHVVELQDKLKTVLTLPAEPDDTDNGIITITYTDPRGRALQTTGKLYNPIRYSRRLQEGFKLSFQITLKSADPDIVNQTETDSVGTRGFLTGSLQLPTVFPAKIAIKEENTLEINHLGNTYAHVVITINGALTNPRVENLETGRYMSFTKVLTAGEKIVINSSLGTIVDENGADISNTLDAGSSFIKLRAGVNNLYLTSDENTSANPVATRIFPAEVLEVEHRDTYL